MAALSFYDSNILLYAISNAPEEAHKQARAQRLIDEPDWALSAQVLQEFYVNAARVTRPLLSRPAALEFIELLLQDHPCESVDAELVQEACVLQARFQLSYWDAAIVAAAQRSGAELLLSEDLNHGQFFGSVQVINPFLTASH